MASIIEMAKGGTMRQAELIVKDAKYIPEDKFCFCPAGCAKTAKDILAEIARSNVMLGVAIACAAPDEEFNKRVDQATTLEALGKLVIESAEKACLVLDSLSEADLDREVTMPWGAKFRIGEAILLPISHMTYHDGQINYIQTLLGDSCFHWAE